jgi:hypothetical protein
MFSGTESGRDLQNRRENLQNRKRQRATSS